MFKSKRLAILTLSFFLTVSFPGLATAARLAPGLVPNNPPLQPLPQVDVTPNYSENINTPPQNRQGSEVFQPGSNLREPPPSALGPGPVPEAGEKLPSKNASRWWWAIMGFALLFGVGEWLYRRYQSKKPKRPPRTS